VEVVLPYRPREFFKPIHKSDKRFRLSIIHRRAGKTVGFLNDTIRRSFLNDKPNPRYAYIAPYLRQAKAIAWDYLKHYIAPVPGVEFNESELRVDYLGRRIRLFGADNAEALRGIYLDGVIFDEMDDISMHVWKMIVRPMLVDRGGWAAFCGTPKGQANLFELKQEAVARPDDWDVTLLRASQTGIIPADELEMLKGEMTEEMFNQEFECSFDGAYVGSIYGNEIHAADKESRLTHVPYDPSAPVFTAWDMGWSDDTAIWFFQMVRGAVHIIDYYENNHKDLQHYAEVILGKEYKYADQFNSSWLAHWLPHDAVPKTLNANGRSGAEILHAAGVKPAIVPSLSQQDGIQAARQMWPSVWIDVIKCADGLKALRNYRRKWHEDRKCFSDEPVHNWASHAADAFRYLAVCRKELIAEPNKPKRGITAQPTFNELIARAKKETGKDFFG